jgi:hypothetical protein
MSRVVSRFSTAAAATLFITLSVAVPAGAAAATTYSFVDTGQAIVGQQTALYAFAQTVGENATGTYSFTDDGNPITACTAVPVSYNAGNAGAYCDVTYTATGSHTIVASYSGDSNYAGSVSAPETEQVLLASTTSMMAAPVNPVVGQAVALTATVTGSGSTPTGEVQFASDGSQLCDAALTSGHATCDTTFSAPANSVDLEANYAGDSQYAGSSINNSYGTASITIEKASTETTLTSVQNSSNGTPQANGTESVTFTASVGVLSPGGGYPTQGSVTFSINGTPIPMPGCYQHTVTGDPATARCTDSDPDDVGQPVVATFSQDPDFSDSSSAPLTEVFNPIATSISASALPTPAAPGQQVSFFASVVASSGNASGYITFTSGVTTLCTVSVAHGSTFCTSSSAPVGVDPIVASFVDPEGGYGSSATTFTLTVTPPESQVVAIAPTPDGNGYWIARADGTVSQFGDAVNYGSMAGMVLNQPIVGMATTPNGGGYWLVAADGGIFSFGNAGFQGSTGNIHLNKPIVAMAATPDGKGYYFVASDGGVFAEGDARFQGSMGATHLNQPVVGMAIDPATGGYWLVASDGGIFSFNAPFYGSTGNVHLNEPIVGIEAAPDGSGYRFVASDGGVFSFDLPFYGSTGGLKLNQPMVGMASGANGGYWLVAKDGGLFSFNVPYFGSGS